MSIALDLALFLREQKLDKPLTLTERGLLFSLMFRIGSNPFTWISQDQLAIEADITERNVKRLMSSIKAKGFIEILQDPKDKRKNLYRPAEFLINYHQKNNRVQTKKYRSKLSPKSDNRGQYYPLNRGQYYPLSESAQPSETPAPSTFQEIAHSPKATVLNKTKSKDTQIYCANVQFAHKKKNKENRSKTMLSVVVFSLLFEQFWKHYPVKKNKMRAWKIWKRKKYDDIATLILEDIEKRQKSDSQWQDPTYIPHPATYLNGELWNDQIIPLKHQNGSMNLSKNTSSSHQAKATAKFWEPGNPDYDRVNMR